MISKHVEFHVVDILLTNHISLLLTSTIIFPAISSHLLVIFIVVQSIFLPVELNLVWGFDFCFCMNYSVC